MRKKAIEYYAFGSITSDEQYWAERDFDVLEKNPWFPRQSTGYLGIYGERTWPENPFVGRSNESVATRLMRGIDLLQAVEETDLSDRERRLLHWRTPTGENRPRFTLDEIAKYMDISQVRVGQLKERAYGKVLGTLADHPTFLTDPKARNQFEELANTKLNWEPQRYE